MPDKVHLILVETGQNGLYLCTRVNCKIYTRKSSAGPWFDL